jgi:hypothetical protein
MLWRTPTELDRDHAPTLDRSARQTERKLLDRDGLMLVVAANELRWPAAA